MSTATCDREAEVVRAVRDACWSGELREHAASCSSCAETAFVSFHLGAAAEDMAQTVLPDPSTLWRRARLERNAEKLRRATRLIVVMQWTSLVAAVAVAGLAVERGWPAVRSFIRGLAAGVGGASSNALHAEPRIVLLVSFAVLMGMVLHEMWCHAFDS